MSELLTIESIEAMASGCQGEPSGKLARQLLATMQREEKLRERVDRKQRELDQNRQNVKRLKARVKSLEGRKRIAPALSGSRSEYLDNKEVKS